MRKFVYIFNTLAIILIITSMLAAVVSILWAVEFAGGLQTVPRRNEYYLRYFFSAFQQVIYPLAVAVICLFLSKLAAAFDGPDVNANIIALISDLRSIGKKDD